MLEDSERLIERDEISAFLQSVFYDSVHQYDRIYSFISELEENPRNDHIRKMVLSV